MVERGEVATLNLVLKADVQGSLEALTTRSASWIRKHEEVRLSFVHRAVGGIPRATSNLAAVANATVRRASTCAGPQGSRARGPGKSGDASLRGHLPGARRRERGAHRMLEPEFEEVVTGEAEVREVFGVPRIGKIAGCYVRTGVITRGSKVRFLREGTIIWKGSIASLRRFKDDVREVRDGFECGIGSRTTKT